MNFILPAALFTSEHGYDKFSEQQTHVFTALGVIRKYIERNLPEYAGSSFVVNTHTRSALHLDRFKTAQVQRVIAIEASNSNDLGTARVYVSLLQRDLQVSLTFPEPDQSATIALMDLHKAILQRSAERVDAKSPASVARIGGEVNHLFRQYADLLMEHFAPKGSFGAFQDDYDVRDSELNRITLEMIYNGLMAKTMYASPVVFAARSINELIDKECFGDHVDHYVSTVIKGTFKRFM